MDDAQNMTVAMRLDDGNMHIFITYDNSNNLVVATENGYFSATMEYYVANGTLMGFINGKIMEYVTTLKTWNDIREYMGHKKIGYSKYIEILENSRKYNNTVN